MFNLLNFLKIKYLNEKEHFPKSNNKWAFDLIEGDILQYLQNAVNRRNTIKKSLVINEISSYGPIDSFEVVYNGSFYHPLVNGIKINPKYTKNKGIDVINNELHNKILTKIIEDVLFLSNESLVRLCTEFIFNDCKMDTSYTCQLPNGKNLWVNMNEMCLFFDYGNKYTITPDCDPVVCDVDLLPSFENVNTISYGEDISPYVVNVYEIQKKYFSILLP